jgi:hypothetical protein
MVGQAGARAAPARGGGRDDSRVDTTHGRSLARLQPLVAAADALGVLLGEPRDSAQLLEPLPVGRPGCPFPSPFPYCRPNRIAASSPGQGPARRHGVAP